MWGVEFDPAFCCYVSKEKVPKVFLEYKTSIFYSLQSHPSQNKLLLTLDIFKYYNHQIFQMQRVGEIIHVLIDNTCLNYFYFSLIISLLLY